MKAGDRPLQASGLNADRLLPLAAMPVFAAMALITAFHGDGTPGMLCSLDHPVALNGMALMYLLMSAFHSAPWLKAIPRRRKTIRASP